MSDTISKNNNQPPLVSADIVLHGHHYVPVDIKLVTESELAFLTDAGFRAAITLILKSWQETPATSLPNDDRLLANMAGFGRGPSALNDWTAVRDEALSAFVLCADGRWYCPALAEKADEIWHSVQMKKARTDAARAKVIANREESRQRRLQALHPQVSGECVTDRDAECDTGRVTDYQLNNTTQHDMTLHDTIGNETRSHHTTPNGPVVGSGMISNDCSEPAKAAPVGIDEDAVNSPTMPDQSAATEDSVPPAAKLDPAPAAPDHDVVGFSEGVIQLTMGELEALRRTYVNIHVERELADLERWAGRVAAGGKDWRQAVRNALSKKDRTVEAERMAMKMAAEANSKAEAAGIYRSPGPAI